MKKTYINAGYIMRRFTAFLLCVMLLMSCLTIAVSADTTTTTVEYFEDGSYIVTELTVSNPLARATKTGSKASTYYHSNGSKIFTTTVTGTFSYTSGVSVKATSGSVNVVIHNSSASFVDKFASVSGNSVYGYGCVLYLNAKRSLSPNVTCDKYGNIT